MCGGGFDFFKGLSLQLIDLNPQLSTLFFTRRKSFIFSFENSYNRNIGFWGLIREKRCGIAMYFRRTFSRHFITYTLFSWRWEEGGGVNDAIGEQIKEENHCVRLFFSPSPFPSRSIQIRRSLFNGQRRENGHRICHGRNCHRICWRRTAGLMSSFFLSVQTLQPYQTGKVRAGPSCS